MTRGEVRKIADAVLYEGYLLYPYRSSSLKNRQRWTFGGLYPRRFAEGAGERWSLQTEVLVEPAGEPIVDVELRFLHLLAREEQNQIWQEASDRSVVVNGVRIANLFERQQRQSFSFAEWSATSEGVTRRQEALKGSIEIAAQRVSSESIKLTVKVFNDLGVVDDATRNDASMEALLAAHVILQVAAGEFVSVTDPPEALAAATALCSNIGVWPVLAGANGSQDCILASPIILSDYPEIAPESAGDLFDSSEIDEILTLRILTMTEAEKEEMRTGDERARRLLERTEALKPEQLMGLHGVLRHPRAKDAAARDSK